MEKKLFYQKQQLWAKWQPTLQFPIPLPFFFFPHGLSLSCYCLCTVSIPREFQLDCRYDREKIGCFMNIFAIINGMFAVFDKLHLCVKHNNIIYIFFFGRCSLFMSWWRRKFAMWRKANLRKLRERQKRSTDVKNIRNEGDGRKKLIIYHSWIFDISKRFWRCTVSVLQHCDSFLYENAPWPGLYQHIISLHISKMIVFEHIFFDNRFFCSFSKCCCIK